MVDFCKPEATNWLTLAAGVVGGAAAGYGASKLPVDGSVSRGFTIGAGALVGTGVGLVGTNTASWSLCQDTSDQWKYLQDGTVRTLGENSEKVGQFEQVTINDAPLNIHYIEKGNPKAKTIVLIHGFGGNAYSFNYIFDQLAKDYHVIALDLPGHGYSNPIPEAYQISNNNEKYKDVFKEVVIPSLVKFLEQKNLSDVLVVGNSMGGEISLDLANATPRVGQLVLIGALASPDAPIDIPWFVSMAGEAPPSLISGPTLERVATREVLRGNIYPSARLFGDHDVTQFALPYMNGTQVTSRRVFSNYLQDALLNPKRIKERTERQRHIQQPTLIINAENDKLIDPRIPVALNQMIPHSALVMMMEGDFPDAGHTPMSVSGASSEAIVKMIQGFVSYKSSEFLNGFHPENKVPFRYNPLNGHYDRLTH